MLDHTEASMDMICYFVSADKADSESGCKKLQSDGTIRVIRASLPGEKYSVKEVIPIEGFNLVKILFSKPTTPKKYLSHKQKQQQAVRK